MSVTYLAALLEGDETAVGQIGRNYRIPIGVFEQNPILGVGLGNYPFYYPKTEGRFLLATPFSLYLRLLTELGLIGTSVFLFFIGRIVWLLVRNIRLSPDPRFVPYAKASLIAIVGVMIARIALDGLYTDAYMWVMFAVGLSIHRLARQSQNSTSLALTP